MCVRDVCDVCVCVCVHACVCMCVRERVQCNLWSLADPRSQERFPAEVLCVIVDHPTSADGGRGGHCEVLHLKQQGDLVGHGNALTIDEREDLVVIHDRVHGLDPQCVNRSIKHNPLEVWLLI